MSLLGTQCVKVVWLILKTFYLCRKAISLARVSRLLDHLCAPLRSTASLRPLPLFSSPTCLPLIPLTSLLTSYIAHPIQPANTVTAMASTG